MHFTNPVMDSYEEVSQNVTVFNFYYQKNIEDGSDDGDASATTEDKQAKNTKLSVVSVQAAVKGMTMK